MEWSRREFIRGMVAGSAAGAALGPDLASGQATERLNILYIMTDQQPVSCVGMYGNEVIRTPHLDGLAREGTVLDNMYIGAFPCSPSRACQLTGRYAHNHGVITNDVLLDADVPTLGALTRAAGYATGYFGKWHLGGNMYVGRLRSKALDTDGNWHKKRIATNDGWRLEDAPGGLGEDAPQHGFDTWAGGWKHYHEWLRAKGKGHYLETYAGIGNHNDAPSGPEGQHIYSHLAPDDHMAAFFASETSAFIRKHGRAGTPWCAVLSFYGPHLPVAPPKPWDTMYALDQVVLPDNHRDTLEGKPSGQLGNRTYRLPTWTEEQFKDYIRRYWGYASYIDEQLGKALDAVRDSGQWERTAIVFTSDHGDMVGGHGMIFKLGWCGYEELFRVPAIVRIPGLADRGLRTRALASNVDFLPTLLEAAGVAKPDGLDGASLLPVLSGTAGVHRDAVVADSLNRTLVCRDLSHKYVLNWGGPKQRQPDELYDLTSDPGELVNLAYDPAHEARARAMRARILQWLRRTGHPYADLIAKAAGRDPFEGMLHVRAEVGSVRYLGGRSFEMSIVWHVDKTPEVAEGTYWCFTHFVNDRYGRDADIAFRFTPYPDVPFTRWQAGETHVVGPVKVTIPHTAGPGTYVVRTGFYDPSRRQSPGMFRGGQRNAVILGTLVVTGTEDGITGVGYRPK